MLLEKMVNIICGISEVRLEILDNKSITLGSGGSNEVHKKWSDFIHILKVEPIEVVFKQGGLQKEMGGKG